MNLSLATTMPIMLSQIAAMALMMAVGALLYKLKMVTSEGSKVLTNIACYVSTPAVLIRSFAKPFEMGIFKNLLGIIAVSIALMIICILAARWGYGKSNPPAQVGVIVSNMGFMGIPLVEAVVGADDIIYVTMCMAVQIVFVWTYCVYIVSGDKSVFSIKKIVTNPNIIALAVGLVMFACSYELSGVLESFVNGVANLNTGVGMLLLGMFLAQADLRSLARSRSVYKASALRLIVTTGLGILLMMFVPLPVECKVVVLIAFAAPCGTLSSMLPQLFGGDYRFGAGLVAVSTLLSIITMPLMLMIGLAVF